MAIINSFHVGQHSTGTGILPDMAKNLVTVIKKSANNQLPSSMMPANTEFVLSQQQHPDYTTNFTLVPNKPYNHNNIQRGIIGIINSSLTRKQRKNYSQELARDSNILYQSKVGDIYFDKVLDSLGLNGNSKKYSRVEILEGGNILLHNKNGSTQTKTITERKLDKIKGLMEPVSTSVVEYDNSSQPSNYQNNNLNVSGGTEVQEKKKEKKEFTHTSIYGAIIKNLEVIVRDSDGIRHYQLEVERKGGDIAFTDIPLQKTPYVLEGGSVEIKGDIYNPDGKEIMKGATFQIDAQGKYKDLRELVQKYFKDLTLCSQEASELLKLNNNKTTTIEVIARGRNDHGCSATAVPFLLNIVPKSESETYKMLVKMQTTIENMYNEFNTYKEAGKPVSEKFIKDVNHFLSWSHNIVTKGDLEKYITKDHLEKSLQPIIDYINEKKAKDYGFSLVGAYSGGITKQNHGNLDTEIDIRNAIYSGKADLNLKFARFFADISHRNGSGNIFRDNKQVCEIKNTLTDVELEAQIRAKIGEILYIGPVAKYFSKTARTQAGLLGLSNNQGNTDEKDILNELYAGGFLSIDDKLDLSGGYNVYSSAKRKGWNAGIRLNDLPIFGNGTVTLNAKGNAFFYNAPVNFVEGASLNGEKYKGDVYVAIGKKGIAFVVGAYGSLENQRFILPGFDPSIVNKLNIKTSDIGGFAGIKLRF